MNIDSIRGKAIIISIIDDIFEIKQLTNSFGYDIFKTFIQHRNKPDVNSYIGQGKVEDIKNFIINNKEKIDLIVIDGNLKPSQWFNLEKSFNIKVYDRIRLILEIFKKRADKKEAKLQVRYAELQYEKPFVKELINRARNGEHPGFMAGGEYQVDDYFEMIKKQMKKIKNNLNKIVVERKIHRKNRYLSGFYLVSLSGYTNAGKSSILNLLSKEKIKVEEKLFSTLSTRSRKIKNNNIPILITDTVGFIEKLPSWMINAFHSTLEEIEVADIVLLVVDASDDFNVFNKKLNTSYNELIEIGVESTIIIVLNKIDLISDKNLKDKINYLKNIRFHEDIKIIPISVKNKINITKLLNEIYSSLPNIVKFNIKLPNNKKTQSLLNWIYSKAYVSKISYDNNILISIECNEIIRNKIISKLNENDILNN
jgi:GTP-binding protein HflX